MSTFFFFNDTATTEIYTLSLHDALPISVADIGAGTGYYSWRMAQRVGASGTVYAVDIQPEMIKLLERQMSRRGAAKDRKSTRLNSSHSQISYAVFCLKKKHHTHRRHRAA